MLDTIVIDYGHPSIDNNQDGTPDWDPVASNDFLSHLDLDLTQDTIHLIDTISHIDTNYTMSRNEIYSQNHFIYGLILTMIIIVGLMAGKK